MERKLQMHALTQQKQQAQAQRKMKYGVRWVMLSLQETRQNKAQQRQVNQNQYTKPFPSLSLRIIHDFMLKNYVFLGPNVQMFVLLSCPNG